MNRPHFLGTRFMIALLGLVVLAIASTSVLAADVNLALGKGCTIVTGGTLSSSKVEYMVDGDVTTMWRSVKSGSLKTHTGIVSVDLGSVLTINRVVITEYKQKSVQLIIKVSTDGSHWVEVARQSFVAEGSDNRRSEFSFPAQSARYVQVEAPDAVYAFGIYELEVYAPAK